MKTAVLDFPIKHIDGNLIFAHDGSVTAYFQISGFNYDFLDHDDKFFPFSSQVAFLFNNKHDLHFVLEPYPTNIEEVLDKTIKDIEAKEYPLKDKGIQLMDSVKEALAKRKQMQETSEYLQFIGIQLDPDKNKYKDGNAGTSLIKSISEFFKGLNSTVNRANGLHANDILESEILMWKEQSETVMDSLRSMYNCNIRPTGTAETVYLIEKEFSVSQSNEDIKIRRHFISGETVEGFDEEEKAQKAIRPIETAFLDLQDTNIEEDTPTSLEFRKVIDEDVEAMNVKYLVAHSLDTENHFPNFEWLYNIQSRLPFPVSVSIRAYHQSNERITKRLSNKRLEFEDQKEEARKAGSSTDLSLNTSERGAIQAENYFSKTGQPAYACSFVFKIVAKSKSELDKRSASLRNELIKYGIKIVAPYGEQLNLMMEKIPGSRQINQDYKIETDSGVIAGMMFGATTNIGDNRGFYLGYTERLKRPVIIQPDLAAKSYDGLGNIEDSISAIVAGATGKGKSYMMNLFTYLSVLTGSKALIIDPKGDRKGWESLPMISSEYISKWTLGTDKRDAGCLDPFRTSVDIEEGKEIALDILSYLINISINDIEYSILSEVIEDVSKTSDPCVGGVIDEMNHLYENRPEKMSDKRYLAVEAIKNTLESLQRQPLSQLLFGEVDQEYRSLAVDKPLQIIMVQNLSLPEVDQKKLRPIHQISEAILISITAFTKQYMFDSDRSTHKIILQDEASSIDRSPVGRELMDFIVRKGRYYNTTLLKGSQNATDHGNDVANVGMKFSFGLRKKQEAEEMLEFLNLPQTRENVDRLRNLSKGKCLFQDIYGRTAIVQIDPIFDELVRAFDSSTSTEEERERERRRNGIYDEDQVRDEQDEIKALNEAEDIKEETHEEQIYAAQ